MSTKQAIAHLLEWASSQNSAVHSSVEIYQDEFTGLSFKASENIASENCASGGGRTKLVCCSYQTTLSYLNATPDCSFPFEPHGSQFPPDFLSALNENECHVIGYFFLIQQYLMGEKSFWWNYIRLLPQPDQPNILAIPIWWNEADRRFLHGTNSQPPIEIREALWTEEWTKAIKLLGGSPNWKDYTKKLYFWAATIFGTRSFRASLTIPEDTLPKEKREELYEKVVQDRFSVLLPVLDIGNHDGVNRVEWSKHPEEGHFALSTCKAVEKGEQIYNFYGDKSNSELLVGYGFTLNSPLHDVVNLKLVPTPQAIALRRSQMCHPQPSRKLEEFMFGIHASIKNPLPHGLLETLICMVANNRERQFIERNSKYCLQMDLEAGSEPLYRALFSAIRILYIKIQLEKQRLYDTGESLGSPQNYNQIMALKYRAAQNHVLDEAQAGLLKTIEEALVFESFDDSQTFPAGLLTLAHAFSWLEVQYPDVHEAVAHIIADDQEEELPLDWPSLVIDWDHTYWCVWIYVVLSLMLRDGDKFKHSGLGAWVREIGGARDILGEERAITEPNSKHETFYASASEEETTNLTIQAIANLACLKGAPYQEEMRNFASFIAKEECVSMDCEGVTQQVLAICKEGMQRCCG